MGSAVSNTWTGRPGQQIFYGFAPQPGPIALSASEGIVHFFPKCKLLGHVDWKNKYDGNQISRCLPGGDYLVGFYET